MDNLILGEGMKRTGFALAILLTGIFVFSCDSMKNKSNQSAETDKKSRWYTEAQVQTGKTVFLKNCAVCHGKKAQGTNKSLAHGSKPPPLNGTAHAYHHSLSELKRSINMGGLSESGKMPKFKDLLKEDEKLAAIAYFQSFWSDAVYRKWQKMSRMK